MKCDGSFPNSVVHNTAPARYSGHGYTSARCQLEYNPPIHNYISKLVCSFRLLLRKIRNALLITTTHATRPTHLIILEFIILIVTVTTFSSFEVLLPVHLSITLANDQLDAQFVYFIMRLLRPSTCFEQRRAHHQVKLY